VALHIPISNLQSATCLPTVESTLCALRLGREEGKITIFNPAPANAVLPDEAFTLCDIICPNETEAAIISGNDAVETSEGAEAAALMLINKGAKSVVMTLGARGALVATSADDMEIIASPKLSKDQVVDTTGAGDSFIGSMASFLAKGLPLKDAVRRACVVASITVQAKGAQASYPNAKDLPADVLA
jgi:ribokinase